MHSTIIRLFPIGAFAAFLGIVAAGVIAASPAVAQTSANVSAATPNIALIHSPPR